MLPGAPGCGLGCIVGSAALRRVAPGYLLCYGRRLNRSLGWFLRSEPGPVAGRTLFGHSSNFGKDSGLHSNVLSDGSARNNSAVVVLLAVLTASSSAGM